MGNIVRTSRSRIISTDYNTTKTTLEKENGSKVIT